MNERYVMVLRWKSEGKTFQQISEFLGVSRGRAHQIYAAAKKQEIKRICDLG